MKKQMLKNSAKPVIKERAPQLVDNETILSEIAGIDGSLWQLSLHLLSIKSPEWAELADLAETSGGVNPFYEPAFQKALRGKIIRSQEYFLIVWEKSSKNKIAKMGFPVIESKTASGNRYLRAFENEYAPLATPLVRLQDSVEIIDRFCQLLELAIQEHGLIFRIQSLCGKSPFGKEFAAAISNTKLTFKTIPSFERAGLFPLVGETGGLSGLSKKRSRELTRLGNKLRELGELSFETVTEYMDVLLRFEEFLLLEMKGWKGRKGTSMHLLKKTSAFARLAVTELAREGKCEIFSLRLNNRSIASIITFKKDGRYYPWKIAFDEAYAARSPGSVLMYAMSKDILARDGFKLADSLAKPGTSWMSSIWHNSLNFTEIVVGPDEKSVEETAKTGKFKAALKQFVKDTFHLK